ncbi:uncharacterized protein LOC114575647 [Exaiptasia diaphana]|uniref:Myb/SANT-like DNA-binding domain-containing protein n=1 Tax=Exaiptasia diaphana TaxID=2652724 RepID=A0A913YNZ2_EXADI|nr:uncharacterized protein LOC114575647 [Exaiptasia diaphana]
MADGRDYFAFNDYQGYYNPYFVPYPNIPPQASTSGVNVQPTSISPGCSGANTSSTSSSPDLDKQTSSSKGKKAYDKFSHDQQAMLVSLWAEKHDELESKDNRKVWEDIASQINTKFNLKRATDKYKQKMKYLTERYKSAKDWNKKQSGGHRKESLFFKEIDEVLGCRDIVTLQHVADVGNNNDSFGNEDESTAETSKEERTDRKRKSRKNS